MLVHMGQLYVNFPPALYYENIQTEVELNSEHLYNHSLGSTINIQLYLLLSHLCSSTKPLSIHQSIFFMHFIK